MIRRQTVGVALVLACLAGGYGGAQTARTAPEELRRQVERRFDVLTVREGVVLRPKTPIRGVRAIEVSGGEIAIDGTPATGGELVRKRRTRRPRSRRCRRRPSGRGRLAGGSPGSVSGSAAA
jgi:hypothetical protein